jgi:hypothetical protein
MKGLKFGFPLKYSGPRSPITSKNLKSVADMPELTNCNPIKRITKLSDLLASLAIP